VITALSFKDVLLLDSTQFQNEGDIGDPISQINSKEMGPALSSEKVREGLVNRAWVVHT
jgi:hypothetical protein